MKIRHQLSLLTAIVSFSAFAAPKCTDFSGTWKGMCKKAETIIIKQENCEYFQIGLSYLTPLHIGGQSTVSWTAADGKSHSAVYALQWQDEDQTELKLEYSQINKDSGKTTFSAGDLTYKLSGNDLTFLSKSFHEAIVCHLKKQ